MEKKAVLFDLDGTLLNTIEGISEAMNLALAKNGLPIIPDINKHKYMVGL
ncbi:MAG: HAD hydrolase-like protein, partial [Planctomycetes bacterium]|nr:HAD hydrolase-like protein [Planctomycetota bacterium]